MSTSTSSAATSPQQEQVQTQTQTAAQQPTTTCIQNQNQQNQQNQNQNQQPATSISTEGELFAFTGIDGRVYEMRSVYFKILSIDSVLLTKKQSDEILHLRQSWVAQVELEYEALCGGYEAYMHNPAIEARNTIRDAKIRFVYMHHLEGLESLTETSCCSKILCEFPDKEAAPMFERITQFKQENTKNNLRPFVDTYLDGYQLGFLLKKNIIWVRGNKHF